MRQCCLCREHFAANYFCLQTNEILFVPRKGVLNAQVAHHRKRAMTLSITLECVILILQLPRNNKRLSVQTKAIKKAIFPPSSLSLMSYITEASNVDPSHEKNNKLFY